jgi:hypothetical protein
MNKKKFTKEVLFMAIKEYIDQLNILKFSESNINED